MQRAHLGRWARRDRGRRLMAQMRREEEQPLALLYEAGKTRYFYRLWAHSDYIRHNLRIIITVYEL